MVKWWLDNSPLSEPEARLVAALYNAHRECVFRPNCSTTACQQAAGGSRSLPQSIIAALACLGEMHGPIEEAYDFLEVCEIFRDCQPFGSRNPTFWNWLWMAIPGVTIWLVGSNRLGTMPAAF